jgi:tRNA threonylcarbamoyladenosine biosynthesis protein TsaB
VLLLSLDTASDVSTCALVRSGEVLGERASRAIGVLADADELLRAAGLRPAQLDGLVVGTGPGSFTGVRIGLAYARGLALSTGVPVAGVSTLAALAEGAPGALPVLDARRREVFALVAGEPVCVAPAQLELDAGTVCVGSGAVRYRAVLEAFGARVPADGDAVHVPHARLHARLARAFGPAERVEPIYLRLPDAERARAAG